MLQELYNLGRNGYFDDSVLFGVVNCAFVYHVYIVVFIPRFHVSCLF